MNRAKLTNVTLVKNVFTRGVFQKYVVELTVHENIKGYECDSCEKYFSQKVHL